MYNTVLEGAASAGMPLCQASGCSSNADVFVSEGF